MAEKEEKSLVNMKRQVGNKATLVDLLDRAREDIELIAPKYLKPETVMKMVLIAASRNPRLFECTQASILQAAIDSAEYNLDCSGKMGEGYLVPYWNSDLKAYEAQFIPGYQGFIKLMCQHPSVVFVETRIVYEDDDFNINYGTKSPIHHIPELRPKKDQVIMGAYALVHMVEGHQLCEWMNLSELEKVRQHALKGKKNIQYSPWTLWKESMYRKSVIRCIQKYAPKTPELQKLIAHDNDISGLSIDMDDVGKPQLPAPDAPGDKNDSLIKKLDDSSETNPEKTDDDPPDLSDEEKAVRDRYEKMCSDPKYTDIPEVKNELVKLEGGNFSFHEKIRMALDCIDDIKLKFYEKSKKTDGKAAF